MLTFINRQHLPQKAQGPHPQISQQHSKKKKKKKKKSCISPILQMKNKTKAQRG
jgi:hypothetical protein